MDPQLCTEKVKTTSQQSTRFSTMTKYDLQLARFIFFLTVASTCQCGNYSQKKAIHDTLLSPSNYSPDIRPVIDQDDMMTVGVAFSVVSIKEINDVGQTFECNGFLLLEWVDKLLRWDPADYGGVTEINPKPKDVWRPRLVLLNTIKDRDLFEDDAAPMSVMYDGLSTWIPGAIFPTSCNMDLTYYPYDTQTCEIKMISMNFENTDIEFIPISHTVSYEFYTKNGEWEISSSNVGKPVNSYQLSNNSLTISFTLKRRPQFLVISILLPIAFLSLLNLMVFIIPVESGDKISYGITVLLALSVFMSIMSAMLPSSSESMPLIIYYIFILLVNSVLTVVTTVVSVKIYYLQEVEEQSHKPQLQANSDKHRAYPLHSQLCVSSREEDTQRSQGSPENGRAGPNFNIAERNAHLEYKENSEISLTSNKKDEYVENVKVKRYKVNEYIDKVSLLVFGLIWVGVTLGFFLVISI